MIRLIAVVFFSLMSMNAFAGNFACGQDLNGNGYLGDPGEYESCKAANIKNSVPANQSCLVGYTMMPNGTCMKYEYTNKNDECPNGYFVQNGRCLTIDKIQPTAYCPAEYVPANGGCIRVSWETASVSCPVGTYLLAGRCYSSTQVPAAKSCLMDLTYYAFMDGCNTRYSGTCDSAIKHYKSVPGLRYSVEGGSAGKTYCDITFEPAFKCTSGNLSGGNCVTAVDQGLAISTCPAGYIPENGMCKRIDYTNANYLCSVGTFKDGMCELVKDGGAVKAVCPDGYVIEGGQCKKSTQSNIQYTCSSGTLSGTNCVWDTVEQYCPIGLDKTCLANNGGAKCSPNKCVDIDIEKPVDEGDIDGSMLVDDGKKNSEGLCLDQMFIFNGRAQDCKKPGVSNAFKDCCKSEGKALSDDAGSIMSAAQTMSTVSHVYSAATEAYTAYNAAIQAGQTAAAAMNSGIAAAQNYMMVAFDPTTLAISVAIYVVMKYLATACDQMSMETALMNDSGFCHSIGTYCKKKIKFIGCVQEAQAYCCFNSKLARIIHEQGRPQLKTGINTWGTPEAPLCRGFTPEEFQAVDFGKVDLTEYINEVQKTATDEIQKNMSNITSDFLQQAN